MKTITSQEGYVGTEFFVIEVENEPLKVDFVQQIDDVMISSPDGDVLISWDLEPGEEFSDKKCFLIKDHDNSKEIGNIRNTHIVLRARENVKKPLTVYITAQRN